MGAFANLDLFPDREFIDLHQEFRDQQVGPGLFHAQHLQGWDFNDGDIIHGEHHTTMNDILYWLIPCEG
jgi:hypothetical protein